MRLPEFFEGMGNRLSMVRLMLFMSFFPASWVVLKNGSTEALGVYLGAYAALLGNNKWAERKGAFNMGSGELEASGNSNTSGVAGDSSSGVAQRSAGAAKGKARAF